MPKNAIFFWSPVATFSFSIGFPVFSTGTDSPVKDASSIFRFTASTIRPSAGILSPVLRRTMSPGTSSLAGISSSLPPLKTFAIGAASRLNASNAFSALYS